MNHTISATPDALAPSAAGLGQTWARSASARRWLTPILLILICMLPLWLSAGDHPLYAPDEGRYGSVSINMVESGNWLVPMINGQPHLTKPPLIYWLQASCTKLLGDDELALRLPSLVAASLTLLITFGLGWHWAGARRGLTATALLALAPLPVLVGRLAITDSLLTTCWTGALAAGVMAVDSGDHKSRRSWWWSGAMWFAVAVGLMTKGPLALVPVGLLLLWIALTGQRGAMRRLHIPLGLPLAILPIGIWVFLIMRHEPEAIAIWKHEMLDRASGSGDHPEPFWYYIPILIGGMFPITATLSLPGLDYSWRDAWKTCRTPQLTSLLALAVVAPFLGFTLMSGKLATYVLPLGPPLALLGAKIFESRLLGDAESAPNDRKARMTIAAIGIAMAVVVIGIVVLGVRLVPDGVWTASLAAAGPIIALAVWFKWRNIALESRRRAIALLWVAGLVTWIGIFEFEDALTGHYGTKPLMAQVHAMPGLSDPIIATVGYQDQTLFRYLDKPAQAIKNSKIGSWLDSLSPDDQARTAILAKEDVWGEFSRRNADIANRFHIVGHGTYRVNTAILVLRPAHN